MDRLPGLEEAVPIVAGSGGQAIEGVNIEPEYFAGVVIALHASFDFNHETFAGFGEPGELIPAGIEPRPDRSEEILITTAERLDFFFRGGGTVLGPDDLHAKSFLLRRELSA